MGFGSSLSSAGKKFLTIYGIIYIVQLIIEHWLNFPITKLLYLDPNDFKIYQTITHIFIHDPKSPFGFLINAIVFYFFSSQVERSFGTGRFFTLFYTAALSGAITGLLFAYLVPDLLFSRPSLGMTPSLIAVIVVFGFLNPNASILLFFVLPVRAVYISYGTIIVTVLTLLAKVNPYAAYHLGGIAAGYLFLKHPFNLFGFNRLYLLYLNWQHEKKKRKFNIVDGGKDDDENKKGPTLH